LKALGIELEEEKLNEVFVNFKELADKKKQIYDEDLYLLVNNNQNGEIVYELKDIVISCGTVSKPSAVVILNHKTEGEKHAVGSGDGPVDSAYQAVNRIINIPNKLLEYSVNAVTEGIDAQATVSVKIEVNEKLFSGSSSNTDITVASVIAYIDALNKAILYGRK
jgi:2-isopropylmalate synthase